MKIIPVIVVGFGPVGRAFVRLMAEKSGELRKKYQLDLRLKAILRSSSAYYLPESESLDLDSLEKINNPDSWQAKPSLDSLLDQTLPGVVIEVTSSDLKKGEPGYDHIRTSLEKGWHVVTANKGPLLLYFSELRELASSKNLKLKFSGATAAALPALDVGQICLAGSRILKIEGILNGTTNYILTRMAEGLSYAEALAEAQQKGIAEKNPAYDVEGWDTAVKLALLAAALFYLKLNLKEMEITGITGISREEVVQAVSQGKKIKLLGTLSLENESVKARVRPEMIASDHPLFSVDGSNKGLSYFTDTMGELTITGGKSDPRGAAAAMLKDLINIYRPF
jgi:homoserine dehydrogenase